MNIYHRILLFGLAYVFILSIYFIKEHIESRRIKLKIIQSVPDICMNPSTSGNATKKVFESFHYPTYPLDDSFAIITYFASKDFIPALEVFLLSFNSTNSLYPLVFAIPTISCLDHYSISEIDHEERYIKLLITSIRIILSKYPHLPYRIYSWPLILSPLRTNPRWRKNYSKLHLWEMIEYEKLFYVDLDVVFMDNIDEVFDINMEGYYLGSYDYGKYTNITSKKMNGGVFLLKPNEDIFIDLIHIMTNHPKDYIVFEAEQGLFNYYFNKSSDCCLPYYYNTQKSVSKHIPELWDLSKIKILHFVGEKPWMSWSSVSRREYRISIQKLKEYKKKDSWDAHEYNGLHDTWKILYFTARKTELQHLNVYILPSSSASSTKSNNNNNNNNNNNYYGKTINTSDHSIISDTITDDETNSTLRYNMNRRLSRTITIAPQSTDISSSSGSWLDILQSNISNISNEWKLYFQFSFRKVFYLADFNQTTFPSAMIPSLTASYRNNVAFQQNQYDPAEHSFLNNQQQQHLENRPLMVDYMLNDSTWEIYQRLSSANVTSSILSFWKFSHRKDMLPPTKSLSKKINILSLSSENAVTALSKTIRRRLNEEDDTNIISDSSLSSSSSSSSATRKTRKSISTTSTSNNEKSHDIGFGRRLSGSNSRTRNSRRLGSRIVKYMALVELDDITALREPSIDWTKVQLFQRSHLFSDQDKDSAAEKRIQLFYWHRKRYSNFYKETDYYSTSSYYRSHHHNNLRSSTSSSMPYFWSTLASHISFTLPEMMISQHGTEHDTYTSPFNRNNLITYYPVDMKNFIISTKVFEVFVVDLNQVIESIISSCADDTDSISNHNMNSTTTNNFTSTGTGTGTGTVHKECLCFHENDDVTPSISDQIMKSMFLLTGITRLHSSIRQRQQQSKLHTNKNSNKPSDTNNMDTSSTYEDRSNNILYYGDENEVISCFQHIFKVYWLVWLKTHNVELIYAVDLVSEDMTMAF